MQRLADGSKTVTCKMILCMAEVLSEVDRARIRQRRAVRMATDERRSFDRLWPDPWNWRVMIMLDYKATRRQDVVGRI